MVPAKVSNFYPLMFPLLLTLLSVLGASAASTGGTPGAVRVNGSSAPRAWRRRRRSGPASPPPPAVSLRGGGGGSTGEEEDEGSRYAAVGLLPLGGKSREEGEEETHRSGAAPAGDGGVASLLRALSSASSGGVGRIIALPSRAVDATGTATGTATTATVCALPRPAWDRGGAVAETMGSLCDVLILAVHDRDGLEAEATLEGLLAGIRRRKYGGVRAIVVVVGLGADESIAEDVRERLRDRYDSDVLSVQVVAGVGRPEPDVWSEVAGLVEESGKDRARSLVPWGLFEVLTGNVYASLSGNVNPGVRFESAHLVVRDDGASPDDAGMRGVLDEGQRGDSRTAEEEEASLVGKATSSAATDPGPSSSDDSLARRLAAASATARRMGRIRMSKLESKQEDVMINASGNMAPLLEFGAEASKLLDDAAEEFDSLSREGDWTDVERSAIRETRASILYELAGASGLYPLYQIQLQSLREHHGRQYESVLVELVAENDDGQDNDELRSRKKETREATLAEAARTATESFRAAAVGAIPTMCREGRELSDAADDEGGYGYVSSLEGLIRDMMESTEEATGAENDWDSPEYMTPDEDEESDEDFGCGMFKRKRRGAVKWYEKLAARVLVLGVNYFQGWLALQSLRRAAAERDRVMPKFPLF